MPKTTRDHIFLHIVIEKTNVDSVRSNVGNVDIPHYPLNRSTLTPNPFMKFYIVVLGRKIQATKIFKKYFKKLLNCPHWTMWEM